MSLPENNFGYPYNFSALKRQKIEGYLAWKWGIQDDLPDDHPYKYQQPNTTTLPTEPDNLNAAPIPEKPDSLNVETTPKKPGSLQVVNLSNLSGLGPSNSVPLTLDATDTELEMIWVQPGTFTMGQTEVMHASPEHEVTLTKGFYLGKYEVTQSQYEAVMTGNTDGLSATPSFYSGNPNRPVETVSWDDIQVFLERLNEQAAGLPSGWAYVLPTEAQWEYACRAGTTTQYSWGDSGSTQNANYDSNHTTDVGSYPANPWGFFDMHGNVSEWAADWFGAYSSGAVTDPEGPATGSLRVVRDGSYTGSAGPRSATRSGTLPSIRYIDFGFRLALKQTS